MNNRWIPLMLVILLAWLAAGCSAGEGKTGSTETVDNPAPQVADQPETKAVINRGASGSYSAEFEIQFSGAASWSYRLNTRRAGGLQEMALHLDGLPPAQNPGDIRLVTDGAQTWMTGEGTEGECIQFPNGLGMDPVFLYPESLAAMEDLDGAFRFVGEESYGGGAVTLLHYQATGATTGPWTNAAIDIRQEKAGGTLYMFSMQAEGEDPFYGTGAGKVTAHYGIGAAGDAAIEPVAGCEISAPLPEGASMFVRLPGMASFESQSSAETVLAFYQQSLAQEGWSEVEPPAQAQDATVLSYQKEGESVEVYVEAAESGGCQVQLLFMQGE